MIQAIGPRGAVGAIVLAVVSALLVFAPGAFADDETVSITNSGFSPMSVSITPGDTVTWQNNSSSSCTINFLVSGPAAPATISPGGSGSATFAIAGTYQYICSGVTANVGTIIVETVATATPTGTLTPTATMTNTPTSTVTATATGSATPTRTATMTPTTTPTRTATLTPTATRTATATIAPATAVPTPRPPATGAGQEPGSPAAWLAGLGLLAIAGGLGAIALRQSGSRRA